MVTGNVHTAQARPTKPTEAKKSNDPLAFDVFSSFMKEEAPKSSEPKPNDVAVKQETTIPDLFSQSNEEMISKTNKQDGVIDSFADLSGISHLFLIYFAFMFHLFIILSLRRLST